MPHKKPPNWMWNQKNTNKSVVIKYKNILQYEYKYLLIYKYIITNDVK